MIQKRQTGVLVSKHKMGVVDLGGKRASRRARREQGRPSPISQLMCDLQPFSSSRNAQRWLDGGDDLQRRRRGS